MRELVRKVGTPKSTHFGAYFNVITKSEPMNLAYTSATLGLHLDLPFYDYTPGVQLLQCVRQHPGPGGANQFADAFAVAERMRTEHPEEFQLLSTVEVPERMRVMTEP
jgi:gamma-butyrobetaine dioxygenase